MDYVLALGTLLLVFIVPAFIVAGLVGAPQKNRDDGPPPSPNP
jgi:hypothetical protein